MSHFDSALGSSAPRYAHKRSMNPSSSSSSNRKQSIKFEIELPMNMSCADLMDNSDYESDYEIGRFTRSNSNRRSIQIKQPRQTNSTNFNDSGNQTICFKISIDNNMGSHRKSSSVRSVEKAFSISSGVASSGYSSSMSTSSHSLQYMDNESNNNAFCSNYSLNSYSSKPQTPQAVTSYKQENIYDKLSYNNINKRRYSLASVSSSSAESNQSESDIYEEITNFTHGEIQQKHVIPMVNTPKVHTYCNEQIQKPKVAKTASLFRARKDYTVNEIFQNVKCFKEEASKQEEQVASVSKTSRSVNILKQLFESNVSKKSKQVGPSGQEHNAPMALTRKLEPSNQHVYVNEKISSAVIV